MSERLRFSSKLETCFLSGVSVFHFKSSSNRQCEEISPFINTLCLRYPLVHFFMVTHHSPKNAFLVSQFLVKSDVVTAKMKRYLGGCGGELGVGEGREYQESSNV